jgi:hypothetical protein
MYDLKKVDEVINLMRVEKYHYPMKYYYIIDEFEWKQRQRNPLLIKVKQLRKELNNKKKVKK